MFSHYSGPRDKYSENQNFPTTHFLLPLCLTHFHFVTAQNIFYANNTPIKYPNFQQFLMELICRITAPDITWNDLFVIKCREFPPNIYISIIINKQGSATACTTSPHICLKSKLACVQKRKLWKDGIGLDILLNFKLIILQFLSSLTRGCRAL